MRPISFYVPTSVPATPVADNNNSMQPYANVLTNQLQPETVIRNYLTAVVIILKHFS